MTHPDIVQRLLDYAEDPMRGLRVEVPKALCNQAATEITTLRQQLADVREWQNEARFLLARIEEMDWSQDPDEFARQWHGHVEPPLSRLSKHLKSITPGGNHG